MSFDCLLKDAKELVNNPNKLKQTHANIRQMEFHKIELCSKQFHNLVFMVAPEEENWDKYFPLRYPLCGKTLETIVKKIKHKGDNPVEIFHELSKEDDWFKSHFVLSARFDPRLMGHLWIRDLREQEKEQGINGSFYIEDGGHRALIYALYLAFEQLDYDKAPVMVYHTKTWEPILPWAQP
ncbi:MAG: hypothetical protein OXH39_01485 [Candidatus Poribacteria bacterium]|nr:hypothetical protein [Candidatus Poribacteria bacterium]